VHFGYREGVPLPGVHASRAVYGKMISDEVHGIQVVKLWPHTFPLNAKTNYSKPLAALWRPQVSGFLDLEFGLSGSERRGNGQ
jgi:hypothetical protein